MIWIFLVPILLLLIGLADLPIGYYTLVRIIVCLVSAFSAYISYEKDSKVGVATVVYALLAILFNPIVPIYLRDKDAWAVLDILAAVLLAVRCYTLKKELK